MPNSIRRGRTELTDGFAFWAVWGLPFLAVLGTVAWRRFRTARESGRAENLRRGALFTSKAGLDRAVSSGADHRLAAAEAVLSYLSARLDIHASVLTRQDLLLRLQETGAPEDIAAKSGESSGYRR